MKSKITLTVVALLSHVSILNAQSAYRLQSLTSSSFGANGGTLVGNYILESGSAVPGIGNSFDITYNYSAWSSSGSNTPQWTDFGGGYVGVTNNYFELGNNNASASITVGAAPTVAGWNIVTDLVNHYSSGFSTSNGDKGSIFTTPDLGTHGMMYQIQLSFKDGNGDGLISKEYSDLRSRASTGAFGPETNIIVYQMVPETSSALIAVLGAMFVGTRRRR